MRKNNRIYGRANDIIKHYIELRGVGIIDLSKLYGAQIMLDESPLDLIIELVALDSKNSATIDRLGEKYNQSKIYNIKVPKIIIPVKLGRSISEIVETCVAKFKSDKINGNAFIEFNNNFKKIISDIK